MKLQGIEDKMIKTILITGASSGIGAGLAEDYAGLGTTLHLLARRQDKLEQVAQRCRSKGANVYIYDIDVRNRSAMQHLISRIEHAMPLDLVIANAGISGGTGGAKENQNYDQDQMIFDVNVGGVLHTIHPVIPYMTGRHKGHIAIISSLASYLPLPGAPAYTASKAAVRFYGEALAVKLRPQGVFVSVICPGFVTSEMTAANDFVMPFLMPTDKAVQRIRDGIQNREQLLAFPKRAAFAIKFLQLLPITLQNTIFSALPEKKSLPNT